MNISEKLIFIKEVVDYRTQGYMGPGCPAEWFLSDYVNYNNIQSDIFPKYVIFAPNEDQLNHWSPCILINAEDIRYSAMRPSMYIIDKDETLEFAWRNGYKLQTYGKLHYRIIDEEYYVNEMYKMAKIYYEQDIESVIKERQKQKIIKETKEEFSKNFFKL